MKNGKLLAIRRKESVAVLQIPDLQQLSGSFVDAFCYQIVFISKVTVDISFITLLYCSSAAPHFMCSCVCVRVATMQQKQTMKLRKQSSNNNKLASIAGNTQHTTDSKRRATNVASFNGSICQHAAIKTPNNTTTIQTELANSGIQRNWRTDRTMATHPQLLYLYVVVVILVYMFEICLQQPATCHICWRFFILALEKITPC